MNKRREAFVLGTVSVSIVALVVALALQLFVLNPKADRNRVEIVGVSTVVRRVICAQAGTTANATRIRLVDAKGHAEGVKHYLTRLLAQRYTLRLSKGLNCDSPPGFPPYEVQLRRALEQIDQILGRLRVSVKDKAALTLSPDESEGIRGYLPDEVIPPVRTPTAPQIVGVSPGDGQAGDEAPPKHNHPPEHGNLPEPTPEPSPAPSPPPAEEAPGKSKGKGPPESLPEVVEEVAKGVGHGVEEVVPVP